MAVSWNKVTNGQTLLAGEKVTGLGGFGLSPGVEHWEVDIYGGLHQPGWRNQINAAATAANAAKAYRSAAEDSLTGMLDTYKNNTSGILSTLNPILQGGANVDDYLQQATQNYGKINQYAEEAKQAASGITNVVNDVRGNAASITNIANSLSEYSPILKEMGQNMYKQGSDLVGSGQNYIGQGSALLGLDKNASGIAGTYANILAQLDPSLAVTTAANDVRGSYDAAMKEANRASARQGVTGGSGASAALRQQLAQSLATALAAAKTKTRQTSTESYLAALRGAVADANSMGSAGASIATQGVNAQAQGANAVESAAGVLVNQGQLYGTAANANAQAGQLLGTQANALTAAGQLTTAGGQLALGAANAKTNATNTQISAANTALGAAAKEADLQGTIASYYGGMFNQYAQLAGLENLMR